MSSVLIKGMDVPRSCGECIDIGWNYVFECRLDDVEDGKRLENCPLIPVQPHGRLVDADAMLMRINHEVMEAYMDGVCYGVHPSQEYLYLLGEIIDDAPTIIPASEEGEI